MPVRVFRCRMLTIAAVTRVSAIAVATRFANTTGIWIEHTVGGTSQAFTEPSHQSEVEPDNAADEDEGNVKGTSYAVESKCFDHVYPLP